MRELLNLFALFFKMGAVTFGGGYAMLPILQRELVEKRHYVTEEEIADYYAIGQCTPGIIAVNTATFIGCKLYGIPGGVFATFGVVAPSIVIITIIAMFLTNFADNVYVAHAFAGIRVCVCILILDAVIKLGKKSVVDVKGVAIFLAVLAAALFTDISTPYFVIVAGLAGLLLYRPKGGIASC